MERRFRGSSNSVPSFATSSTNNYSNEGSTFSESRKAESTSNNNNNNNESSDFECNICFELAQDPIVTLCGHLFCWPCLYKWLQLHSLLQECPVCKALIQQHKLVPLYGRGKSTTDPRLRPVPGVDIPNRPPGQRPETAAPPPPGGPNHDYFTNFVVEFMPMASRFGNISMSAGFSGFLSSLLAFPCNGFPHNTMYSAPHGFPGTVHGHVLHHHDHGHGHDDPQYLQRSGVNGQDNLLKNMGIVVGVFVLAVLCWL